MNSDPKMNAFPFLPEHLDREIERRAAEERKAKDVVIIEMLERGLGIGSKAYSDLDFLAGSWEDDPAFDEAVKSFEVVDEDHWR